MNLKDDETVWFSYIEYASKEHRDEVNAKIRAAARVLALWSPAGCASPWVLEEARAAAQDALRRACAGVLS